MIPRLGAVKVWHFAHKIEQLCSGETYLDRLGKRTLRDTYARCLETGQPYRLVCMELTRCTHYEAPTGVTCAWSDLREFDLTQYFDRVALEADHGGFRADVLLSSSCGPEVLLLEVAVTHRCDAAKCASGVRIAEVMVDSEERIATLRLPYLDTTKQPAGLLNFRDRPRRQSLCNGWSETPAYVFVVHKSRKSVLAESVFVNEIFPRLAGLSAQAVRGATGLSISYCRRVLRGQ